MRDNNAAVAPTIRSTGKTIQIAFNGLPEILKVIACQKTENNMVAVANDIVATTSLP
jgi:hypothetical protein